VRWGLPAGIPTPEGRAAPLKAHVRGQSFPSIRVTPWGTAQACAWYLTDGREALYMGVSDFGAITLLRWRSRRRGWEAA
jgi:hypothetical protein